MHSDERMDERIDEAFLPWFGHVETMKNDRILMMGYVGKCAGSHSVGRPRKRWIDITKDLKRKRKKKVWMSGKQGVWCITGVNIGGS